LYFAPRLEQGLDPGVAADRLADLLIEIIFLQPFELITRCAAGSPAFLVAEIPPQALGERDDQRDHDRNGGEDGRIDQAACGRTRAGDDGYRRENRAKQNNHAQAAVPAARGRAVGLIPFDLTVEIGEQVFLTIKPVLFGRLLRGCSANNLKLGHQYIPQSLERCVIFTPSAPIFNFRSGGAKAIVARRHDRGRTCTAGAHL
jgi:hypothetical protein